MNNLTGVVKNLLAINILLYIGSFLMGEPQELVPGEVDWGRLQLAIFFPTSEYFQPYQIVTHMFMHGGFTHLLFNMFAIFMFGPPVEATWGPQRFLTYYFITGFGALALYLLVKYFEIQNAATPEEAYVLINTPMLGASGAVFGLLTAYGMLFPNSVIQLLIPPIPLKAKYFVVIYAVLELFLGLSRFNTGVAHFAHVGGALFGFLLIVFWRQTGKL